MPMCKKTFRQFSCGASYLTRLASFDLLCPRPKSFRSCSRPLPTSMKVTFRTSLQTPSCEGPRNKKSRKTNVIRLFCYSLAYDSITNHCCGFRLSLENGSTVESLQNRHLAFGCRLVWRRHRTDPAPFCHGKGHGR